MAACCVKRAWHVADWRRRLAASLPVGLVGLAAVVLARDFPAVPGQSYGPALFPTVLGSLLIGCSIGVLLQAPKPCAVPAARRARLSALAYALAPLVVILGWDTVGWPLTALGVGTGLLMVGGMRAAPALLTGAGFAALTWVLFAMLLRVPLPRGPLTFMPY